MHHRLIRIYSRIWMVCFVCGLLVWPLPLTAASVPPHGATTLMVNTPTIPPAGHCNTDAVAFTLHPQVHKVHAMSLTPHTLQDTYPLPFIPDDTWFSIYTEGYPTVVYYTENLGGYKDYAVIDPHGVGHKTPAGNMDTNTNQIPDYAERVLSCMNRAWVRLDSHFKSHVSGPTYNVMNQFILTVRSQMPEERIYPVVLRKDDRTGQTLPLYVMDMSGMGNLKPFTTR